MNFIQKARESWKVRYHCTAHRNVHIVSFARRTYDSHQWHP